MIPSYPIQFQPNLSLLPMPLGELYITKAHSFVILLHTPVSLGMIPGNDVLSFQCVRHARKTGEKKTGYHRSFQIHMLCIVSQSRSVGIFKDSIFVSFRECHLLAVEKEPCEVVDHPCPCRGDGLEHVCRAQSIMLLQRRIFPSTYRCRLSGRGYLCSLSGQNGHT
jgi:hypothetical protein